jgi:hypothetical protein
MLQRLIGRALAQRVPIGLGQQLKRDLGQATRATQPTAADCQRDQASANARRTSAGEAGRSGILERPRHHQHLAEGAFMRVVGPAR